jgi:hypothetical protein
MLAGIAALEEGEHDNVHVHFFALCKYIPNERRGSRPLERWLRSRDCTVPGCDHPPDDRCDECRHWAWTDDLGREHVGRACNHVEVMPGGNERKRCPGSWYVDVREAYSRRGRGRLALRGAKRGACGSPADAAAEVVKYACKPVVHGNPHDASPEELIEERAHARRVVLFYLALRGRHRVETYGFAREVAPEEGDAADDAEPTDAAPRCSCGNVGCVMVCVGFGKRTFEGSRYEWGAPCARDGCAQGPSG